MFHAGSAPAFYQCQYSKQALSQTLIESKLKSIKQLSKLSSEKARAFTMILPVHFIKISNFAADYSASSQEGS